MTKFTFDASKIAPLQDPYKGYPQWMKDKRIWVIAAPGEKVPLNPVTDQFADSTNPETWHTYEQAVARRLANPSLHIGYMHDGTFTTIDLDWFKDGTNPTPEEVENRRNAHDAIINEFAEHWQSTSVSGKGRHILVQTPLENNRTCKSMGAELYTHSRFMIETFMGRGKLKGDETGYLRKMWELFGGLTENTPAPNLPTNVAVQAIVEKMVTYKNFDRVRHLWYEDYRGDSSDEDGQLMEFIWHVARTGFDVENRDLVIEVFEQAACWSEHRIAEKHNKRSGKVREYLEMTADWAYGVTERRRQANQARAAEMNLVLSSVIPEMRPKVAEVVKIEREQTTGYPDLDELAEKVLTGIPQESQIWQFSDWCDRCSIATAGGDQPLMSVFGGIALVGITCARRYRLENLSSTTAIVCVGPSGCSKDVVRRCVMNALIKAGLVKYVGAGDIGSGAAIRMDLADFHPIRLYAVDEFGDWWKKVEGQETTKVSSIIRETVGRSLYLPPKILVSKMYNGVQQPGVSFLGLSTVTQMMNAFGDGAADDGTLQRFAFAPAVSSKSKYPYVPIKDTYDPPDALLDWMEQTAGVVKVVTNDEGEVQLDEYGKPEVEPTNLEHKAAEKPEMVTMSLARDAWKYLEVKKRQKLDMTDRVIRNRDDLTTQESLETRRVEFSKRYGMILALSCGRIEVTLADVKWGEAVAALSACYFEKMQVDTIRHGEVRSDEKKVRLAYDALEHDPSTLEWNGYKWRQHKAMANHLGGKGTRNVFNKMVQNEFMEMQELINPTTGRKARYYRLL